ncbi:MAG: DUF3302 domain-containing protein, partial [Candidatus Thiodiazotropha sp.]
HVAGWVSLFTLHVIWPFLWIWSTLYREDRGWGFNNNGIRETDGSENTEMAALRQQLEVLSERVETLSNRHHQTSKSEQEG